MTISTILKEELDKILDRAKFENYKEDLYTSACLLRLTKRIIESEIGYWNSELRKETEKPCKHQSDEGVICSESGFKMLLLKDVLSHLESELKLIEHDT